MKRLFLILILLTTSAMASDLDVLKSYDCERQGMDFQIKANWILSDRIDFYNKDEILKLKAAFYKSTQDQCKVNAKEWCKNYKNISIQDFEVFKTLYYFKCQGRTE